MFELLNSMELKFFWKFEQENSTKFIWWKEKSYEIQIFELKFCHGKEDIWPAKIVSGVFIEVWT